VKGRVVIIDFGFEANDRMERVIDYREVDSEIAIDNELNHVVLADPKACRTGAIHSFAEAATVSRMAFDFNWMSFVFKAL